MTDTHARYRRLIDIYRSALREVDPSACRLVDARVTEVLDEGWVCNDDPPDVNAIMSAPEIARQYGFAPHTVHQWCREGQLQRYGTNTRPKYRVGDVLAFQAARNK